MNFTFDPEIAATLRWMSEESGHDMSGLMQGAFTTFMFYNLQLDEEKGPQDKPTFMQRAAAYLEEQYKLQKPTRFEVRPKGRTATMDEPAQGPPLFDTEE